MYTYPLIQRRPSILLVGALLLALLAVLLPMPAQAAALRQSNCPNYGLDPAYGSVRLNPGFMPDPHTVRNVWSGGNAYAGDCYNVPAHCPGYVARAPDYRLRLSAESRFIRIFYVGDSDSTLLINGPDGEWYCNDDANGTYHPAIEFDWASSGQYDIWVGTYYRDDGASGQLYITEYTSVTVPNSALARF